MEVTSQVPPLLPSIDWQYVSGGCHAVQKVTQLAETTKLTIIGNKRASRKGWETQEKLEIDPMTAVEKVSLRREFPTPKCSCPNTSGWWINIKMAFIYSKPLLDKILP